MTMVSGDINDLRAWLRLLETEGQLNHIEAPVHWREELGAVVRKTYDVYGDASPALLFENIVDYPPPGPSKLFVGQFRSYSRIAMAIGLPPTGISRKGMVHKVREAIRNPLPHQVISEGWVHENVLTGDEADIFKFPIPLWHHRDGGRYIGSMGIVVSKELDGDWVNCGIYRVMAVGPREMAIYVTPGRQHIGRQLYQYMEAGRPMPVALCIGIEPTLPLVGAMSIPAGLSEYDVAGALKGSPIEVTSAVTADLPVPAHAEIIIEGEIDPHETVLEGPFGEYPGYYGDVAAPKPLFRVKAITHRNDPIFQGSMEGHPVAESHVIGAIVKVAALWDLFDRNGIMGIQDVACIPEAATGHLIVSIKPTANGHADWVASAVWGASNAIWNFKHIIVVDEDIDPWDAGQVNWSIAWRVKASEDIKIWPRHRGSPIDPRQAPEEKGFWDRVLIDATRPFHWEPRRIWGSKGVNQGEPQKFPPSTQPEPDLVERINARWDEFGVRPVEKYIGTQVGMMRHWWD